MQLNILDSLLGRGRLDQFGHVLQPFGWMMSKKALGAFDLDHDPLLGYGHFDDLPHPLRDLDQGVFDEPGRLRRAIWAQRLVVIIRTLFR